MEIMEDGNLVDRVRILLQRDLQYYQEKQTVLREPLCVRVSGGKLDFPRHASFAATKIVSWWETEFRAAFKRDSGLSRGNRADDDKQNAGNVVIKDTLPSEFVVLLADTSDQFLEHLHTLIQESLDHADLTVLTATLGAAALVRNALWCYSQRARGSLPTKDSSEKLNKCYKAYHEMAEAVAERLLDLHCRLISLYILNEADSLDWQAEKPFFERERSSFVVQMWWLYMEGTRADLWDTVPPKMAQRVFSGMLNESLSIITTRFIHGKPSLARSEQFWTDAFNVLCCTAHLAVAACSDSHEISGLRLNRLPTAARDLHSKCHELLVALLLRGVPMAHLFQSLRNGLEKSPMLRKRHGPAPWLLICAPKLLGYPKYRRNDDSNHLQEARATVLELNVLRAQPQPNWTQLVKVLSMNGYAVSRLLLTVLVRLEAKAARDGHKEEPDCCDGFLCARTSCSRTLRISPSMGLFSLVRVLTINAEDPNFRAVFVSALKEDPDWARHLDKQQVWNQFIPAWLEALLIPFEDTMLPVADTLLEAVKTGASTYQAMSLVLACFAELHSCTSSGILRLAVTFDENLPADCRPIGGSVLLQLMCAALYSRLLVISQGDSPVATSSSSAIALAEAVCSIDEDNKHTDQINHFLRLVKLHLESPEGADGNPQGTETLPAIIEVKADRLLFTESGRRSFKVAHECLVRASDWILERLKEGQGDDVDDKGFCVLYRLPPRKLTRVMFHVGDEVFDQFLNNHDDKDWKSILSTPLSIGVDRLRRQLLLRAELKNIPSLPTMEEREIAVFIKQLCSSNSSSSR